MYLRDSHKNMIYRLRYVAIASMISCSAVAFGTRSEDLRLLDNTLSKQAQFDSAKEEYIRQLEYHSQDISSAQHTDTLDFEQALCLFEEYKSYNYARSKFYADQLLKMAEASGDNEQLYRAQSSQVFALLSAGLFKEAYDMLQEIRVPANDRLAHAAYHELAARLMLDMAVYAGDQYGYEYGTQQVNHFKEGLKYLTPQDTFPYYNGLGSVAESGGEWSDALTYYELALRDSKTSTHDSAIVYSAMAFVYDQMGDKDAAFHYNVLAADADIRSCTKETIALRRVAQTLYEDGLVTQAARYIRKAKEDAQFYGAKHREVELMQILPIIEAQSMHQLEKQTRRIWILTGVSLTLLLVAIIALILLYRRIHQLRSARSTIEEMNNSLLVANRLKEEYIGTTLCWQSQYLGEVERYQQMVKKRAQEKRWEDLMSIPKNVDAHLKKAEFYKQFDKMFLSIFPSFVKDFNALLRPEYQIEVKKGELLNAELRIFALLRLGVTHNEVIADVLDYSLTTVYTYKTKTKSHSDLSNEEFQERLMAIPSFIA